MNENSAHKLLVRRAVRWLRRGAIAADEGRTRKYRCGVVLSELMCSAHEIPDAIGWSIGGRASFLVECKASRADFFADQGKLFRRFPHLGVGRFRYYMTPPGMLRIDELPPLWGLLEVDGNRVRVVRAAEQQPQHNTRDELTMMWSALRRVQESRRSNVLSEPCF